MDVIKYGKTKHNGGDLIEDYYLYDEDIEQLKKGNYVDIIIKCNQVIRLYYNVGQ